MRHFRSILYAVVLAPAVWVLVAAGLAHQPTLTGALLLLLGGVAYGILALAPISPLGPALAGLAFLAAGVWAVEDAAGYASVWPHDRLDLNRPGHGPAVLLAAPLLLTALNVRRWRGRDSVTLPLIGQIGQTAAPAPPSVAPVERTTLFGLLDGPDERTTLLRRPHSASPDGEPTTVVRLPADGEATTILRTTEPTTMLVIGEHPTDDMQLNSEAPTEDVRSQAPTEDMRSEAPTEDMRSAAPTEDMRSEAPTEDAGSKPATADVSSETPTSELGSKPSVEDGSSEPPVENSEPPAGSTGSEPPVEEVHDEPATVLMDGEPTADPASEAAGGPEEPLTEAIALPAEPRAGRVVGAVVGSDGLSEELAEPVVGEEGRIYLVVAEDSDQTVQFDARPAFRVPGERTVVVWPAGRIPGETTQMLGTPGEDTRVILRRDIDDTQMIRLADDGEHTQLLESPRTAPDNEPGGGPADQATSDNPAGNKPAGGPAGSRTGLDRGGSIAGAESPNFADDPTGRLQRPAPQADEPARTMTVMNVERPPEIPAPRRSPESEG